MKPIIAYLYPTPQQLAEARRQRNVAVIGIDPAWSYAHRAEFSQKILDAVQDELVRSDFAEPFVWVTHKGESLLVENMATPHIFYSLRMVWNHTVPPVFRVTDGGGEFNRYRDVPHWTDEYKRQALEAFTRELENRNDADCAVYSGEPLDGDLLEQWNDIKANARVILALGL